MGRRGRNRTGYYVALLYALELHYQTEAARKGSMPNRWRPWPRHRPDHFLRWVLDALDTLGEPVPTTRQAFRQGLERRGLVRIGALADRLIDVAALALPPGSRPADDSLPAVLSRILPPRGPAERHPQARKYARVIGSRLDPAWRRALEAVAGEAPAPALLLGGLPPGFDVLTRLLDDLHEESLFGGAAGLTVVQVYGLASGTLPRPAAVWTPALERLERFTEDERTLLNSLSDGQLHSLRALNGHLLEDEILELIRLRLKLGCGAGQWRSLIQAVDALPNASFRRLLAAMRGEGDPPGEADAARLLNGWIYGADLLERLATLMEGGPWRLIGDLDEELMRLVDRGEIGRNFIQQLRTWDDATWTTARHLLDHHTLWASTLIDERRTLRTLFERRTRAKLDLHSLFPTTMHFLDEVLAADIQDALFLEVDAVRGDARRVESKIVEALGGAQPATRSRKAHRRPAPAAYDTL